MARRCDPRRRTPSAPAAVRSFQLLRELFDAMPTGQRERRPMISSTAAPNRSWHFCREGDAKLLDAANDHRNAERGASSPALCLGTGWRARRPALRKMAANLKPRGDCSGMPSPHPPLSDIGTYDRMPACVAQASSLWHSQAGSLCYERLFHSLSAVRPSKLTISQSDDSSHGDGLADQGYWVNCGDARRRRHKTRRQMEPGAS